MIRNNGWFSNEASWDRVVRVALGAALLLAALFTGSFWIGLAAFVPLITGLIGFCPLHKVLGRSTCPGR